VFTIQKGGPGPNSLDLGGGAGDRRLLHISLLEDWLPAHQAKSAPREQPRSNLDVLDSGEPETQFASGDALSNDEGDLGASTSQHCSAHRHGT
jgi:hypothetical protein